MAQLSDMLTYLRKRKGLSQQELANTLKISRSAIGMYETGKREPDLETLEVFADFYNVDMNTLTGKAPIKKQTNKLPDNAVPVDFSHLKRIPILGRIAAGAPIYAEENIEGYTFTDLNGGAEYFALRVRGDSMNAAVFLMVILLLSVDRILLKMARSRQSLSTIKTQPSNAFLEVVT